MWSKGDDATATGIGEQFTESLVSGFGFLVVVLADKYIEDLPDGQGQLVLIHRQNGLHSRQQVDVGTARAVTRDEAAWSFSHGSSCQGSGLARAEPLRLQSAYHDGAGLGGEGVPLPLQSLDIAPSSNS